MTTHRHDLSSFAHTHSFGDAGVQQRERALAWVTAITLLTMVIELGAGWWSGSLALTADGWHMGTHALALGGAAMAYRWSARASTQSGFAFGGWKIEVLAAYTSGLLLMGAALWLIVDSIVALRTPRTVAYGEAMLVAMLGLGVNLVCAWLLARGQRHGLDHAHAHAHAHGHAHAREPAHGHSHGHAAGETHGHSTRDDHTHADPEDHNFRAAYLHVVADAFTSVLAIVALAGGLWFGWRWLDPAVALLGALVIGRWAIIVLRGSGRALIDATEDPLLVARIRELIESDGDAKLADLHVWQVGASAWCAVIAIVADRPLSAAEYRERLRPLHELKHLTLEVHRCTSGT
jgi:cation diffusion facilitator family transporter